MEKMTLPIYLRTLYAQEGCKSGFFIDKVFKLGSFSQFLTKLFKII